MIYVMNQKFLKKNIEKMAKYNPYFIIDGENFAVTGKSSEKVAIATKYNRAHSVGGFCPEMSLYRLLKKMKKDENVSKEKFEKEVKKFIKDKCFIVAVNVAFKALVAGGTDNPLNVFVVLPNMVYKYLKKDIINKMKKLSEEAEFEFIYDQSVLEDDMKRLKRLLTPKELKTIDNISKHIEKKYELKFLGDDDEY